MQRPTTNSLLKEDGFITTAGSRELGAKYGNTTNSAIRSLAMGPPPTSFAIGTPMGVNPRQVLGTAKPVLGSYINVTVDPPVHNNNSDYTKPSL